MAEDKTVGTLNHLIAVCRDAEEFYAVAADKVKDSRLQEMFREMTAMHRDIGADFRPLVSEAGGSPAEGGTLAGRVRQLFGNLKATFSSDTEGTLVAELQEAEQNVVQAFEHAKGEPVRDDAKRLIEEKLDLIRSTHERVKALRQSTSGA